MPESEEYLQTGSVQSEFILTTALGEQSGDSEYDVTNLKQRVMRCSARHTAQYSR